MIRTLSPEIPVIPITEAAAIVGVSARTLRRWMDSGEVASRVVGADARGIVRKTSRQEALRVAHKLQGGSN